MQAAPPPSVDDPLVSLFSGRRQSDRVACLRAAIARGPGGAFEGYALDVSGGGLRLEISDPAFYEGDEDGSAWSRVQGAFRDGLEVELTEEGIRRRATVVRILPEERGLLALGLAFEEPLSAPEAVVLGLLPPGLEDAASALLLDRVAGPRTRTHLLLHHDGGPVAGPRLAARVVGVGPHALLARAGDRPGPLVEIASGLVEGALRGSLVRSRRLLWSGPLGLASCERWPGTADVVALHLVTGEALPPAARRHFRRHAAISAA